MDFPRHLPNLIARLLNLPANQFKAQSGVSASCVSNPGRNAHGPIHR